MLNKISPRDQSARIVHGEYEPIPYKIERAKRRAATLKKYAALRARDVNCIPGMALVAISWSIGF